MPGGACSYSGFTLLQPPLGIEPPGLGKLQMCTISTIDGAGIGEQISDHTTLWRGDSAPPTLTLQSYSSLSMETSVCWIFLGVAEMSWGHILFYTVYTVTAVLVHQMRAPLLCIISLVTLVPAVIRRLCAYNHFCFTFTSMLF